MNAASEIEREVIVALAGSASARRSLRGGAPGWTRFRSSGELVALHEAGHAVIARAVGLHVQSATIIPRPVDSGMIFGSVIISRQASASNDPPDEGSSDLCLLISSAAADGNDLTQAVRNASILVPFTKPRWRQILATVRRLRAIADELIDSNWPAIEALGAELGRQGTLSGSACAGTVDRCMGRRACREAA